MKLLIISIMNLDSIAFFFFRTNLPRIKDRAFVVNLNDKNSNEAHWDSLFIDKNLGVYFVLFETEFIPLEALNKIKDK